MLLRTSELYKQDSMGDSFLNRKKRYKRHFSTTQDCSAILSKHQDTLYYLKLSEHRALPKATLSTLHYTKPCPSMGLQLRKHVRHQRGGNGIHLIEPTSESHICQNSKSKEKSYPLLLKQCIATCIYIYFKNYSSP